MSIKKIVASSVAVVALGASFTAAASETTTTVNFGNMDGASKLSNSQDGADLTAGCCGPGSSVRFPWLKPDFQGESEMTEQERKVADAIERALMS